MFLKNLANLDKKRIVPFFRMSSIILNTESLVGENTKPSIHDHLLPSLITTFGPPLIANSIYHKFHLTMESVVIYFASFLLSLVISKNRYFMVLIREVPYVSKFFGLMELKNSKEDMFYVIAWNVTNDLARICLKKLVKQEKLTISFKSIFNIFVLYGGMILIKNHGLGDYYIILVANLVPLLYACFEALFLKAEVVQINKEQPINEKIEEKRKSKSSTKKTVKKNNKISLVYFLIITIIDV